MELPRASMARVADAKIRDYLLSGAHDLGQHKARVFGSIGYTADNWRQLQAVLVEIARHGEAIALGTGPYGKEFAIRAIITGPNGRAGAFQAIWIVPPTPEGPRFITAYPTGEP